MNRALLGTRHQRRSLKQVRWLPASGRFGRNPFAGRARAPRIEALPGCPLGRPENGRLRLEQRALGLLTMEDRASSERPQCGGSLPPPLSRGPTRLARLLLGGAASKYTAAGDANPSDTSNSGARPRSWSRATLPSEHLSVPASPGGRLPRRRAPRRRRPTAFAGRADLRDMVVRGVTAALAPLPFHGDPNADVPEAATLQCSHLESIRQNSLDVRAPTGDTKKQWCDCRPHRERLG